MKRTLTFIFLFLIPLIGQDIQKKNVFSLILINDALFMCDKDYTGSFGISYKLKSIPLKIKYQIDTYTPCKTQLHLKEPKEGTHPYAGFGYFGTEYKHQYNDWLATANIKLGSTGKYSFAQEAQNGLHTFIGDRLFQGWDTQIQTRFGYSINPKIQYIMHFENFTFLPFIEIELGNIISQQKIGFKFLSGINYNKDFLFTTFSKKPNYNIFITYKISNISKNVFLTGFDGYEYGVDISNNVSELKIGFDIQYKSCGITLQNHHQSKEYDTQENSNRFSTLILYYIF